MNHRKMKRMRQEKERRREAMAYIKFASPADENPDEWECIICGEEGGDAWIERHMKKKHKDDVFDEEWARYVRKVD